MRTNGMAYMYVRICCLYVCAYKYTKCKQIESCATCVLGGTAAAFAARRADGAVVSWGRVFCPQAFRIEMQGNNPQFVRFATKP